MTSASSSTIHDAIRPTKSIRASIPSASFSAERTSALADLRVVDRLAAVGPFVVPGLVGHVGVVNLLGDSVLGDGLGENLVGGLAQRLDDVVRQRAGDDAVVLDQVFHRLGI